MYEISLDTGKLNNAKISSDQFVLDVQRYRANVGVLSLHAISQLCGPLHGAIKISNGD